MMSIKYRVSPHCSFRVLHDGIVEATPSGRTQCSISLDEWRLISEFMIPRTADEMYADASASISIGELRELLEFWCATSILCREGSATESSAEAPSITSVLSPEVVGDPALVAALSSQLQAGHLLVIPDAFKPEFANEVWSALDSCQRWQPFETASGRPGFHFSHHNIDEPTPDAFQRCMSLFDTRATKQFIHEISGRQVDGTAAITASWYQPGDFSLPHTDGQGERSVAFVWHLTKDWDDTWGGQLAWCRSGAAVYPRYNSLSLFNVSNISLHFVAAVSRRATGKRLAVNGWWRRPPQPDARDAPALEQVVGHVTARYGAPIRRIAERIIVV